MFYHPSASSCRLGDCVSCFFSDPATSEIYTLSLHDALPISRAPERLQSTRFMAAFAAWSSAPNSDDSLEALAVQRSEEHTSELQSPCNLVCRLLLEKKKREMSSSGYRKPSRRPRRRPHGMSS